MHDELLGLFAARTIDLLLVSEADGRVVAASASVREFLGRPPERHDDFVHREDVARYRAWWHAVLAGGTERLTCRAQHSGGGVRWFETWAARVTHDGRPHVLTSSRDVTDNQLQQQALLDRQVSERKRAEQELRDMETRFHQAQKTEAIGRLASGIAHDFNNLLTVISGNLDFVLNHQQPDTATRELLEEISAAAERAAGITSQILAFSRKGDRCTRVVDIHVVLGRLQHLLRRLIGDHIEVKLVAAAEAPRVKVDAGLFEHAILNLALNGRDAMPEGGRLTIETRNDHESVVVVVADTGHGMDDAVRSRIFEPFFTTKATGQGTGLGLAMVHRFVERSQGAIDVESKVGAGTTIRLRLPGTRDPASTVSSVASRNARGTETVLLAEDDEAVRTFSQRVLRAQGYRVLSAVDGADAAAVARRYTAPIDILVADLVMPEIGGRALAELLRRERPEIRVLLMSGHADDAATGPLAGALAKPFLPSDLVLRVRDVLDSTDR